MSLKTQRLLPTPAAEPNLEIPMKLYTFAGVALMACSAAAQCQTQPQPQAQKALPEQPQPVVVVKDFDVFLDPPTGFVFVKLPRGWKFVGKVDESVVASLPPKVITSLLPDERDGMVTAEASRVARH